MTTTPPLSEQKLAEIAAREAAATDGPWVRWTDQENVAGWDGFIVVGDDVAEGEECNPTARVYTEGDAAFIAAARTDVPALLAEVLRGDAEIVRLQAQVVVLARWKELLTETVEEFEDAAQDDPATPRAARLMIANLRQAMKAGEST